VSHDLAKELAEDQFEKFDVERKAFEAMNPVSDFDKRIKSIEQKKKSKRKKKGE
jgi:hypothetical protein